MRKIVLSVFFVALSFSLQAQKNNDFSILAYYTGDDKQIDNFEVEKLTHIIYGFCHLKDGKLDVVKQKDSLAIKHLVSLKERNPKLKIIFALGGYGGCEMCSEVFSTESGRSIFAKSVKESLEYFKLDGFDMDWEYPGIQIFPGHLIQITDKANFTKVMKALRTELGNSYELSFAAGGFQKYFDESVEWELVMPLVDRVNIMSYDLVTGYSKLTGHHTALFGKNDNEESADRGVEYLLKHNIPSRKIVIGSAFYARTWKEVVNINNGLYQLGTVAENISFLNFKTILTEENGWKYFWDKKASAPYWYNEKEQKFATGDDITSVKAKTSYVLKKKLGGIMFWELGMDTAKEGLLNAIYEVKTK